MKVTYTYDEVGHPATRTGACPTCGKKTRRSRTFTQTVNPFNKNEDGTMKTYTEVRADVRADAEAWNPDPGVFEHQKCRDERLGYA